MNFRDYLKKGETPKKEEIPPKKDEKDELPPDDKDEKDVVPPDDKDDIDDKGED